MTSRLMVLKHLGNGAKRPSMETKALDSSYY